MQNNIPSGTPVPKLELVSQNPEAAAVLSKAIRSNVTSGFDVGKRETYYSLNQSRIQEVSDIQKQRLNENENILDLFPDILLAKQIMVSSILAPKDMFSENLIYQTVATLLPADIQSKISDVVRENLETYYDYPTELPSILGEALFGAGSYVSAVIPEAAVDEVINGKAYAAESRNELVGDLMGPDGRIVPFGILGPAKVASSGTPTLESFFSGEYSRTQVESSVSLESAETLFRNKNTTGFLEITDNYQILKLPKLTAAIASQRIRRAIKARAPRPTVAYESQKHAVPDPQQKAKVEPVKKKLTSSEFQDLVYKNVRPQQEPFAMFPSKSTQKRQSIGRPLRLKIPSEAVVPVIPPGDPSNHRGYFVLVDADGNWVTRSSLDVSNQGLTSLLNGQNQNNNLTGQLLEKARRNVNGERDAKSIDNMLEVYSSIVEAEMLARLKNGVYGTQFQLAKDKEWDRIMLARALAGKMTRLVYIPAEIITYYAFDYHPNGIGKSYLDNIRILTSLRGILLFSGIMAKLKNSINVTKVDLKIDPEDPDPQKTIEIAAHDVIRLREAYFPLGVNSPADLLQWIQRAGLMFTFSGHPGLPETSFEFSNSNMQHSVPDTEIGEELRKQTFMALGLTPEQVDNGFSPEFATTIIQQNAMFAKRILMLSNQSAVHITRDVRNICSNDSVIKEELFSILMEAADGITKYLDDEEKAEYNKDPAGFTRSFVDRVIENLWVDLPKPEVTTEPSKGEAFNELSEALDKVLTSFISDEVFTQSFGGDISGHANEIKNFWKHHILRKWVAEEGYMPGISEIFKRDEDGNPSNDVLELMDRYSKDVMMSALKFIERSNKIRDAVNKDLQNLQIGEGTATPSPSPGEGDDAGGDGGDMFGGDLGGEDTPPEEGGGDAPPDDSELVE